MSFFFFRKPPSHFKTQDKTGKPAAQAKAITTKDSQSAAPCAQKERATAASSPRGFYPTQSKAKRGKSKGEKKQQPEYKGKNEEEEEEKKSRQTLPATA